MASATKASTVLFGQCSIAETMGKVRGMPQYDAKANQEWHGRCPGVIGNSYIGNRATSVAFCDCVVRDRMVVGDHTFFAGEVVEAGFLQAEDTEVLRMEDTRMNYGG